MPGLYPRTLRRRLDLYSTRTSKDIRRWVDDTDYKLVKMNMVESEVKSKGGKVTDFCNTYFEAVNIANKMNCYPKNETLPLGVAEKYPECYIACDNPPRVEYYPAVPSTEVQFHSLDFEIEDVSFPNLKFDNNQISFDNIIDLKAGRDLFLNQFDFNIPTYPDLKLPYEDFLNNAPEKVKMLDSFSIEVHDGSLVGSTMQNPLDNSRYDTFAKLDRLNPENNIPNYQDYIQRDEFKEVSEIEIVQNYETFTKNHANVIKAELESGLNLEFDSYDPVQSINKFSDEMVETFENLNKGMDTESGDNTTYNLDGLNGISFVDKNSEIGETIYKGRDGQETWMAYDLESKKIYVREDTPLEVIQNGGLYHAVAHADLENNYGDDLKNLEQEFGFQRAKPQSFNEDNLYGTLNSIDSVVESFEEVAVHVKTHNFMNFDKKYAESVHDKYGLDYGEPKMKGQIDRVFMQKSDDNTFAYADNSIAEMMATFYHIDRSTYDIFKDNLEMRKNEIGKERYDNINSMLGVMKESCAEGGDFIGGLKIIMSQPITVVYDMPETKSQLHLHMNRAGNKVIQGSFMPYSRDQKDLGYRELNGKEASMAELDALKKGYNRLVSYDKINKGSIGQIGNNGSPSGIIQEPDYLKGGFERYRQPEYDDKNGKHMNYETLIPGVKKPIINKHIPMSDLIQKK